MRAGSFDVSQHRRDIMEQRGRPTPAIELSDTERDTLQRWVRRHSSAQALAQRSRIVLACAAGATNGEVAAGERVHPATVGKWRRRFAAEGLEGLCDAPRPGAERTIADETIEAVIVDTLESTPGADSHWSTRGLAAKHGISKTTVAEIWRAFGLKPWRQDSFKVSPGPDLIEKVRDLVGLYMNPPMAAAVFAVDEKPQIQALNRTAPTLPMLPSTPQRATHDYERNGTVDWFAALDIASGAVISDIRPSHNQDDFIAFLNKINREVPAELDVHVILDNLSTHKTPKVQRWLLRHRRFHLQEGSGASSASARRRNRSAASGAAGARASAAAASSVTPRALASRYTHPAVNDTTATATNRTARPGPFMTGPPSASGEPSSPADTLSPYVAKFSAGPCRPVR